MKILAAFAAAISAAFLFAKRGGKSAPFTVPSVHETDATQTTVEFTPDATVFVEPTIDVEKIPVAANKPIEIIADTVAAVKAAVFGTPYDALIVESANSYGVSPDTLYKLLYQESRFREDIITGKTKSPVGALGIAQFMPATAIQELGSINAALDPKRAIPGAARYLAKLIKATGSVSAGVAAYNWGIGNVQRQGLARAPRETVNYVSAIVGVNIKET